MPEILFALSMPGGPEWFFIFVLCLLLFGAKRLPELARGLGKSMGEFQKAKAEIEREIAKAAAPVEIKEQTDKVPHIADLNAVNTASAPLERKAS
jgi:sec-independent protein translocase protein TatA